ncbi:ubiquitinyl hydrolase [Microthyrium microscopicum]|uniref:Ubiquitin carboxyl-terminal hydrolase n=1 Tax=Microthyrium microscopicum TaxID=703497 RepID=A0A6A6TZS0_9PEZI|nr:ubiquitinyl hydrolase [Microthyrium microscopicum]
MSGGWNTIESDAGVFTHLLEGLGAKGVQFEELVSLDADSLHSLSPIYGVIFLFKWVSSKATDNKPEDGTFDTEAAENIFFAQQVIQNACGTQALLSVLLNIPDVDIGAPLREFKDFTIAFPPDLRGETLSNSDLIRSVHNSFARASPFIDETQRTSTDSDDVYHFIAYTSVNGILYELDGLAPAPISHGACLPTELPDKVVPVLQRRINRYPEGEIHFNLLAMIRDPRIRAKEIGDVETLHIEERKRREWVWENSLRRHNFVGFVGDLTKGVVKAKQAEGDDSYKSWIEGGKKKSEQRMKVLRAASMKEA